MRIISGKYRGRHFDVPRSFKARPTTDFAKENLFNVLRAHIDYEATDAMDLFSGTGSITLELLSRGCRSVLSVEADRQHAAFIATTLHTLGDPAASLLRADALKLLRSKPRRQFGLIFADPPYTLQELPELPALVFGKPWLTEGGTFVLEHSKAYDFSENPHFYDHRAYGSVNFSFFRNE